MYRQVYPANSSGKGKKIWTFVHMKKESNWVGPNYERLGNPRQSEPKQSAGSGSDPPAYRSINYKIQ